MLAGQLVRRGILDPRVLCAMAEVPRHLFVPPELRHLAYGDHPVNIGYGQTISQPFMVARMLELLRLQGNERVLEVGTGSGYQAALLARLCARVFSLEILPPLVVRSRALLAQLGCSNVEVRLGDGYAGWPEEAPFDGIVVAAAPSFLPRPLLEQLAEGGVMVIPVGPAGEEQALLRIVRHGHLWSLSREGRVLFVPLKGATATGPPRSSG